jgi:hypothetical protein
MEEIKAFLDIFCEVMDDAVTTPYGNTFSERSIKQWLSENDTCPLTKKPLNPSQLKQDISLRKAIEEWKQKTINSNDSRYRIKFSDLKFEECISKGETSDVYKGSWMNQKVAIKKFRFSNPTEKELQSFKIECSIAAMLSHPSLSTVYGFCDEKSEFCIVRTLFEKQN